MLEIHLAAIKTESLEKTSTSLGKVLHHHSFYVNLELKEINILPVRSVKSEDVPSFADLIINSDKKLEESAGSFTCADLHSETTSR